MNCAEFTFVARSFDRLCDTKRGGFGDSSRGIIVEGDSDADGGGVGDNFGTW